MIEARIQPTGDGAILFDAGLAAQADERWFDADWWREQGRLAGNGGGRGQAVFVDAPFGDLALRHYHRGGFMARLSSDRYFWSGAQRTRAFREFHLLAKLQAVGLPVPAPVAARYRRDGLRYRADLLTRRIADALTLAQRLAAGALDRELGTRVGACIGAFHRHGVYHADLNAHNVLIDAQARVWLLDFDRGRLRPPAYVWQQRNLARLRRSLLKLGAAHAAEFESAFWHPLLAAYHGALGGTTPGGGI